MGNNETKPEKRTFTTDDGGIYKSIYPYDSAKKAFRQICKKENIKTKDFVLNEINEENNEVIKTYKYKGTIIELEEPKHVKLGNRDVKFCTQYKIEKISL